jgi:hypothetical protein
MSQKEFLRDFDAGAFASFIDAGMADAAMYTTADSLSTTACDVLVDRNVRDYGDDAAPVGTLYTLVTFQRAQVSPSRGGTVAVEGESFMLDAEVRSDESISRWVVTRV